MIQLDNISAEIEADTIARYIRSNEVSKEDVREIYNACAEYLYDEMPIIFSNLDQQMVFEQLVPLIKNRKLTLENISTVVK